MPFYDEDCFYYNTLKWDDIFTSATQFIAKVVSIGGISESASLTELYEILSMKYVDSHTRYTNEFAFIMALKRELYTEFPYYLQRKSLASDMMALEIAEVQRGTRQLRNLVDLHDEPIVDANTVPIDDLSTQQESIEVTNNKLEAIKAKYNSMNRNFLQGIYNQCDDLFRVILASDERTLYEEN